MMGGPLAACCVVLTHAVTVSGKALSAAVCGTLTLSPELSKRRALPAPSCAWSELATASAVSRHDNDLAVMRSELFMVELSSFPSYGVRIRKNRTGVPGVIPLVNKNAPPASNWFVAMLTQ